MDTRPVRFEFQCSEAADEQKFTQNILIPFLSRPLRAFRSSRHLYQCLLDQKNTKAVPDKDEVSMLSGSQQVTNCDA